MPANNNYNRTIPDAPLPVSMLPRPESATALTVNDLLLLIQPGNDQGQKCKALTLAMLAAFLQFGKFSRIEMNDNDNGLSQVLTPAGTTVTKASTGPGYYPYTLTETADGIEISLLHPNQPCKVKVSPDLVSVTQTVNGLEYKAEITHSGLTISSQTRDGSQVVTTTNTLNTAGMTAHLLSIIGEYGNWKFEAQTAASSGQFNKGDLRIGDGMESMKTHILSKLCVWRQAYFDKDVEINGDLSITNNKTLTVTGHTTLNGVSLKQMRLTDISGNGGNGVWKASQHGPDYLFYNQSESRDGAIWWVMNDTGNDISVAYDYHSSSGGGTTAITLAMPANSIAAFMSYNRKWWRWIG